MLYVVLPFQIPPPEITKRITILRLDKNTEENTAKNASRSKGTSWVWKYFRKDRANRVNICCLCE
jgi:hypothetical protein